MPNVFHAIPGALPEELMEDLVSTSQVRIERIVSRGHTTPTDKWYDQDEHEWVMVAKGQARLLFQEGMKEISLNEGDYVNIPAHVRHQVSWTKPDEETIWLAIFYHD